MEKEREEGEEGSYSLQEPYDSSGHAVVTEYKSSLWCGPHRDDQTEIRLTIPLVRTECINTHLVYLLLHHWLGVF